MTRWTEIARAQAGSDYAITYAARFRAHAARGHDIHGEAKLIRHLVAPITMDGRRTSVLDAGCGTGRIATKLAEWGYEVVGSDVDGSMLSVAREQAPHLEWLEADLAGMDLGRTFDVVLLAGNIIPLLEPGTLSNVAQSLAKHTGVGGRVTAGFGLDEAHLPGNCPVTPLSEYDEAMAAAGLVVQHRWSTWNQDDPAHDPGYAVTVSVPQ
jgi:SAM-dependent methyltransferase